MSLGAEVRLGALARTRTDEQRLLDLALAIDRFDGPRSWRVAPFCDLNLVAEFGERKSLRVLLVDGQRSRRPIRSLCPFDHLERSYR